jgi:hypothetical protein
MNANEDKAEVARQKIMKQHFPVVVTEEVNMLVFARMPETVMPFAIEWIGRTDLGLSLMYNVARGLPTLFDTRSRKSKLHHSRVKKRKR